MSPGLSELVILLVCVVVPLIVLGLGAWVLIARPGVAPPERDSDPLDALERRYARGEIDEVEFDEARRRLDDDG